MIEFLTIVKPLDTNKWFVKVLACTRKPTCYRLFLKKLLPVVLKRDVAENLCGWRTCVSTFDNCCPISGSQWIGTYKYVYIFV